MRVIFVCLSCEDMNKQWAGTEGFELKTTEFESFTEAFEHLMEVDRTHNIVPKFIKEQ